VGFSTNQIAQSLNSDLYGRQLLRVLYGFSTSTYEGRCSPYEFHCL